tara:strand:- start:1655 stop:3835 length:2181 start_codon:yes stop_codon:yes gene_type:complete
MIKKILFNFVLTTFFLLIIFLIILSTIGIKTNRFNKLISDKITQTKKIELELKTINYKLDLKELSLFLETEQPKINYNKLLIPTKNIKVYIDFLSLIKADLKIEKINLTLDELDIVQLNKLSKFIKPSNFKNFLNNKIKSGKLISEIEIFINNRGILDSYIIKGDVKNLEAELLRGINLSDTNFNFFADKEDILIKSLAGNVDKIKISSGDIKLNLEEGINLSSNFRSNINLNDSDLNKYSKLLDKFKLFDQIKLFKGNFSNNVSIVFDDTYKLKKYNYNLSGNIEKSKLAFSDPIKNSFIIEEIKEIYLSDMTIDTNFSQKDFTLSGSGKYSFDNLDFLKIDLENKFSNNLLDLNINFDFKNSVDLGFMNYMKPKNTVANLSLNLEKKKNLIILKKINFKEKNNTIKLTDLKFKNNNFFFLKKAEIQTLNNNFSIQWDKKILIKGTKFDATNLPKFFNNQGGINNLKDLNKMIEINFKNIKAPVSEKLKNFRLIGKIQKGKFVKITSKGDFGGNNFLDISMKKDSNTKKRFLEIYSDLPRPLLTEYKFFNGLSGGKLLFTSLIDGQRSNSKLKIENFKVVNAPGVIKLLSLADLGGLADLAEGEGLTFDILEIDMEKNKNFLKINEILALGPSISVLMEGYQDEKGVTSLKGTLVPAKTLNKMISKIPVIGNIVIPKEVGEGLFGISFKIKGPKDKIKTTINPIRTLTPRFIQKILDKNKIKETN